MTYVGSGSPIPKGHLIKRTCKHEELHNDGEITIIVVYEYETGNRQYPIKGHYELRADNCGYYFSVECDNRDEMRVLIVGELIKWYTYFLERGDMG